MPLPKEPKDIDAVLDGIIMICDVQQRQIVAIANMCRALKSDAPATFTLPDPPKYLLEKLRELMEQPKT